MPSLGVLRPTHGDQAAFLTTAPDAGADPSDANISILRLAPFTIPAETTQLRFDYVFLTNELTPSKLNDRLTVTLVLINPAGEDTLLEVDTFATPTYPAPLTGYAVHTGFRTLVADVSAYAGTGEAVSLELRLSDVGDGRADSAVFVDNMQLTSADEPQACANVTYLTVDPGAPLFLDGSCSTDAADTIVEYRQCFWERSVAMASLPAAGCWIWPRPMSITTGPWTLWSRETTRPAGSSCTRANSASGRLSSSHPPLKPTIPPGAMPRVTPALCLTARRRTVALGPCG